MHLSSCTIFHEHDTGGELIRQVPAVSVIIPLYNKANDIGRTLEKALSQTFENFEILIINDGSTDHSEQVVRTFTDPRIRIFSKENGGVCTARNMGIREARGSLIAFLDADDIWKPNHLAVLISLTDQFPECGAFTTAYEVIEPTGNLVRTHHLGIPDAPWEGIIPNYFRSCIGSYPVWTSATAVKKCVFDDVGTFKVGIHRGEDLDMWGRIALKYPIAFSTNATAVYNKQATNRLCLNQDATNGDNALDLSLRNALQRQEYRNEINKNDIVVLLQWRSINRVTRSIVSGNKTGCLKELISINWSRRLWKILLKGYCYWLVPHHLAVLWLTRNELIAGLKVKFAVLAVMRTKHTDAKPEIAFPISIENFRNLEQAN